MGCRIEKYKRTQEIRNENGAKIGIEEGEGRGVGGVRANTVCELMKDGLRNWTILVNLKVLGMKSRHYPFRSLVYNCIFHLSTG